MGPWRSPGQYGANIRPIAASAKHNAFVNVLGTVLVHRHGHQNRQRVRCICLLSIACMLAVAGVICNEYSTDCGVQWLQLKL
jgi:hypothetical protein